jgi:proprotein convertase subtilisin/kexin type 5
MCNIVCPFYFYGNTNEWICQPCPYDCYTCSFNGYQNGSCTTCNPLDYRMLDLSTQRCIPISGYFDNYKSTAVPCPQSCRTCKSLSLCISCIKGTFLGLDGSCSDSCPPRYYANPTLSICQNCPYDCYNCDKNGSCI